MHGLNFCPMWIFPEISDVFFSAQTVHLKGTLPPKVILRSPCCYQCMWMFLCERSLLCFITDWKHFLYNEVYCAFKNFPCKLHKESKETVLIFVCERSPLCFIMDWKHFQGSKETFFSPKSIVLLNSYKKLCCFIYCRWSLLCF